MSLVKNYAGMTPFHQAVKSGHMCAAKNMLSKSWFDINDKEFLFGKTPLHIAVSEGRAEMIKFILDNKAHIDSVDYRGATPLVIAILNKRSDIVNILIKKGARIDHEILNLAKKNRQKFLIC